MKEKLNFEKDDFIKHIVENPTEPRGTVFLQGFLGDSDKEDHIRLYYDPGLNHYADIKKDDVLYLQKIAKTKNPLGGVMLWIKQPVAGAQTGQAGYAGYASQGTPAAHVCQCGQHGHGHSEHTCQCSQEENMAAGQRYFQGNVYNRYLGQQQGWPQAQQQVNPQVWPTSPWHCPPTKKCR